MASPAKTSTSSATIGFEAKLWLTAEKPKILEAFHRTCAPLFEQAEANRTEPRTLATLLSGEITLQTT